MEKLSETRLRLQSIIHSLSDGVIVIMKDGRIDEANNGPPKFSVLLAKN